MECSGNLHIFTEDTWGSVPFCDCGKVGNPAYPPTKPDRKAKGMMHIHFGITRHNYAQWILKECRCGKRLTIKTGNRGGYSALMCDWPKPGEGWK